MTDDTLANDPELRALRIETTRIERDLKAAELRQKNWDYGHPSGSFRTSIRSPIIVAALLAALGTAGASLVSYINAQLQRETDAVNRMAQLDLERAKNEAQISLDQRRHEASLINNAIDHGAGNPDKTAENLQFLLDTGLILQVHSRAKLEVYLMNRRPGQGASGILRP